MAGDISRWLMPSVLAALAAGAAVADDAPTLRTEQRTIRADGGPAITLEAGTLSAPERRAWITKGAGGSAERRRVSIPYYRLRSSATHPAAPIFMLAGGPGEPALDQFDTDPLVREIVVILRAVGDVVILDQRGAGRAQPRPDCTQRLQVPLDQPLTRAAHSAALRDLAAACRDDWQRKGIDLAAYNTLENAADVEDLRRALGYKQMSLLGHSYGTHLALALMRHYPDSIDRAILFGVEGPDHTYDLPSLTLQTLRGIAAAAERNETIAPLVPEGGFVAALERVEQQIGAKPLPVTVERDGRPVTITLSVHDIQRIARLGSYDRSELSWPANVIRMARGDFTLAANAVLDARAGPIDSAMFFMMDCASGISPARQTKLVQDPAELHAREILGDINLTYSATCDVWQAPDLGSGFRADAHSQAPVLFLQGTWDMSTAHVNAVEVARGFPNGTVVTVVGGTHFVLQDLLHSSTGTSQLLQEFLRTGKVHGPTRITLPEVKFTQP